MSTSEDGVEKAALALDAAPGICLLAQFAPVCNPDGF